MEKKTTSNQFVFAHVTLGIQLAITIFIFVWIGYKLDLRYHTSPLFLIIGTVIGMVLGFYHLMKSLSSEQEKEDVRSEKKSRKWNS